MKPMTLNEFRGLEYREFEVTSAPEAIEAALLRAEVLEKALQQHRHTEKCFRYAAKTAARHGNAYCLAECAEGWKTAMRSINDVSDD